MNHETKVCVSCGESYTIVVSPKQQICSLCAYGVSESSYVKYLELRKKETYTSRRLRLIRRFSMLSMYNYMLNRHLIDPENLGKSSGDYRGFDYSLDHIMSLFTCIINNKNIKYVCHPMNIRVCESSSNKRKRNDSLFSEEDLERMMEYFPCPEMDIVIPFELMSEYLDIEDQEEYLDCDYRYKKSIRKMFRKYLDSGVDEINDPSILSPK